MLLTLRRESGITKPMPADQNQAIRDYLKSIQEALARGDAGEHTHRLALQQLVQALDKSLTCTNEPGHVTNAGHPDMKVSRGETPLGFIETKDVGLDLNKVEKSEQMTRYLQALPNLILTDYLEFRWYQYGKPLKSVRLATSVKSKGGIALKRLEGSDAEFQTVFENFINAEVVTVGSPKELAQRMASLARLVRTLIAEVFESEAEKGDLHAQLESFRATLIPDLDPPKFADMYAQTICYGLFASICNTEKLTTFARENAADHLPKTNPFLRKLFHHIVGPDLNPRVRWAVEQIVVLLKHADIASILKDFGKRTRQEDPVVHFYETFLAQYDPKLRKSRGVYYTPEPVVSYIVRSVDWLLKEKFNKPLGLADPSVLVLDPACGTGTFLYAVIQLISDRIRKQGQYGSWNTYVRQNLLPRIFGFELLMAPYAVAHLKLGLLLQETGYDFSGDERLGIYLTNTLEEAAKKSDLLFAQWIAEESNAASEIKKDKPVMVVLGNPPYSGHSANQGQWITDMVRDSYLTVDGNRVKEVQLKWLHDDYVKFIRWSQWRLERTGAGIHAFISNNGYLDNPTFRGMRQQLTRAFDELYILDLHGNSKKKEVAPDGSKDENVFDIQQGVAIGIFVRSAHFPLGGGDRAGVVKVSHADIWGEREAKYRVLLESDTSETEWGVLKPETPLYLMVRQDVRLRREFDQGWPVGSIMAVCSVGIVTARDDLTVGFNSDEVWERVRGFGTLDPEAARMKYDLGNDVRDWKVADAQDDIRRSGPNRSALRAVLYRPFDVRWTYYTGQSRGFIGQPQQRVMSHMLVGRNLGVILPRRVEIAGGWQHALATRAIIDHVALSSKTIDSLFPLYLYGSASPKKGLFDDSGEASTDRKPNLAPEFVAEMEKRLGLKFLPEQPSEEDRQLFGPEDVFNYIYAILHSPTYRKRYAEFLKIDFPRVPLTSDKKLFRKLVALGGELVSLHLMESPKLDKLVTTFPVKGSDTVEKVQYLEPNSVAVSRKPSAVSASAGRVFINKEQYFAGIKPEEWEFHIGGYQVLQKWLKDRKGRKLSNDDLTHYQRIVVAIRETIRLMADIDKAIPKWPVE